MNCAVRSQGPCGVYVHIVRMENGGTSKYEKALSVWDLRTLCGALVIYPLHNEVRQEIWNT